MAIIRFLFPRSISRREAEYAYLNGAVTLIDLERREREIMAGKFKGY